MKKDNELPTLSEKDQEHYDKYGIWPKNSRQNTYWYKHIRAKCKHKWQPLSFVFEPQMLDDKGRVEIRQPNIISGKVYCVCMKCLSHTYVTTAYAGFYIGSPDDLEHMAKYPEEYEGTNL